MAPATPAWAPCPSTTAKAGTHGIKKDVGIFVEFIKQAKGIFTNVYDGNISCMIANSCNSILGM